MAGREVRILHASIAAPADTVYAYVAEPRNMPAWAPNFGNAIAPSGSDWIMQTALGGVRVRFAPPNDLGVLDHWVDLPGGRFHNPVRVVPDGQASVLSFTLFRQDGFTDADFDHDEGLVRADLARLKAILEAR